MATNLTPWNGIDVEKLKVWVHHILPLVYDDSLSYYEVLTKVSAKMNEVIKGLNANNEQVEKVTGFTIEQVQNLTMAFNNFQQSMLNRQENFENTLNQDVNTWETQLEGDIADWKAETEEAFNKQYQDFLSAYKKHFGVVQARGDSTTDVMSQKAVTDIFNNVFQVGTNVIVNKSTASEYLPNANKAINNSTYYIYNTVADEDVKNLPIYNTYGLLATFSVFSKKLNDEGGNAQLYITQNALYFRISSIGEQWTSWVKLTQLNTVQARGDSTTNVMSQAAVTNVLKNMFEIGSSAVVNHENASGILPNANKALNNSTYYVYNNVVDGDVENLPIYNDLGLLATFSIYDKDDVNGGGSAQLYFTASTIYFRIASIPDGWTSWRKLTQLNPVQARGDSTTDVMSQKAVTDIFNNVFQVGTNVIVNKSTANEYLPNANKAINNSTYYIYNTVADEDVKNLPIYNTYGLLATFSVFSKKLNDEGGNAQLYITQNALYFRISSIGEQWTSWVKLNSVPDNVYFGAKFTNTNANSKGLDANTFDGGTSYIYLNVSDDNILNLPAYGRTGTLFTQIASEQANTQSFVSSCNLWYRNYQDVDWNPWCRTEFNKNMFCTSTMMKKMPFKPEKIYAFGDSITANNLRKSWAYYLGQTTGIEVVNYAVNGAAYTKEDEFAISTEINKITEKFEEKSLIIVAAGVNDIGREELKNKVSEVMELIKSKLPTQYYVLFITPIRQATSYYDYQLRNISACICQQAVKNGFNVLDGYSVPLSQISDDFVDDDYVDGLHPNDNGEKIYGAYIESLLF